MILSSPIPFREAMQRNDVRRVMPTNMGSAELRQLHQGILQRSFFMARNTLEGVLQTFKGEVGKLIDGTTDPATVRLRLKESLQSFNYEPSDEDRGTIKDLSSDRRLNLAIKTNLQMAQNFGHWRQGQDPAVLDQWPAQELFRATEPEGGEEAKRPWLKRWRMAGESTSKIGDGWTITPDERMIALKNHPIWDALGSVALFEDGLGNPFPPFAFNSGMEVRDIERDEAMALGLIDRDTQIAPKTGDFSLPEDAMPQSLIVGEPKPDKTPAPKAPKESPTAPVSEALEVVRANSGVLEQTKAVIDDVHEDGTLPQIPVDGKTSHSTYLGEFERDLQGNARRIGVKNIPGQELTFTHEIGHFIDAKGLGTHGFASEAHPDLQEWRDAIRKTQLANDIKAKLEVATAAKERKYYRYLISHCEMWARSYAQFIAEESGDPPMMKAVKERVGTSGGHWAVDDFKPVKAAIEKLFRKKGWMK
jgi:hypothetical protein